MIKLRLNAGNIYVAGGTKYLKNKIYTVNNVLGNMLLASKNARDIPYFVKATAKDEKALKALESGAALEEDAPDTDIDDELDDEGDDAGDAGDDAGDEGDEGAEGADVNKDDAPKKPVVDPKPKAKVGKKEKTVQV